VQCDGHEEREQPNDGRDGPSAQWQRCSITVPLGATTQIVDLRLVATVHNVTASGFSEVTGSEPDAAAEGVRRPPSGPAATAQADRPPHRVLIFVVVGLALLMSALDGTIVATALHAIERGLHTSINWTSWTITAYAVGLVLMLSLAGRLSTRYGRRRFFLVSVGVFAVASLFCGLATNVYVLIGLRVLQAAGGAGFTPSATSIVVEYFGSARDRAVGLFGSIFPLGSMIGPIFGGLFVAYWSWRGIFLVNVPIGIVLVLLCLKYVPRDSERPAEERGQLDVSGMALLGVGVLALMVGISELGESSVRAWSPVVLVPLVVGVLGLVQFGRHLGRSADPFIPPTLITGRGFFAVNVVNVVYIGANMGFIALVPLYAIDRYHIGALGAGTLLAAEGAGAIVVTAIAAMTLRRTGYRLPLYIGAIVIALGMVALALRPSGMSPYSWLAIASCLSGVGSGLISPASRNAGLQLIPKQSAALAALRSTGIEVGAIATISITSAILAQSADPGRVQAVVFIVFAGVLVLCMPIITRIPQHRGAW
jgi:EmrB/QacA subfamily drug resistance transporter